MPFMSSKNDPWPTDTPIGAALRKAGLTQAELARRTELSESYINRVKNGRVEPGVFTAIRIADALDASVHDLFEAAAA